VSHSRARTLWRWPGRTDPALDPGKLASGWPSTQRHWISRDYQLGTGGQLVAETGGSAWRISRPLRQLRLSRLLCSTMPLHRFQESKTPLLRLSHLVTTFWRPDRGSTKTVIVSVSAAAPTSPPNAGFWAACLSLRPGTIGSSRSTQSVGYATATRPPEHHSPPYPRFATVDMQWR
jgi:hypothetical protein